MRSSHGAAGVRQLEHMFDKQTALGSLTQVGIDGTNRGRGYPDGIGLSRRTKAEKVEDFASSCAFQIFFSRAFLISTATIVAIHSVIALLDLLVSLSGMAKDRTAVWVVYVCLAAIYTMETVLGIHAVRKYYWSFKANVLAFVVNVVLLIETAMSFKEDEDNSLRWPIVQCIVLPRLVVLGVRLCISLKLKECEQIVADMESQIRAAVVANTLEPQTSAMGKQNEAEFVVAF